MNRSFPEHFKFGSSLPARMKPCREEEDTRMSLLILLSLPALSALMCMVTVITRQTLYMRLKGRACQVIPFPVRMDHAPRPKAS